MFAFKTGRDASGRVYPKSGVSTGFHPASHHGGREDRILQFHEINKYHVSLVPYFLEKLKNTPDGDGSLLDHSLVIYGSPMGDGNMHNHVRCPLFLAGHANGKLKGNLHIARPTDAPMANAMLSVLHMLGHDRSADVRRQHRCARSEQPRPKPRSRNRALASDGAEYRACSHREE